MTNALGLTNDEITFIERDKTHSAALRVLQWFAANGPATVYECELQLGAKTASPRVNQLAATNCLYLTGERRRTRGQHTAAVYAYREGSSFITCLGLPPPVKRVAKIDHLSPTDRKILEAGRTFVEGIQLASTPEDRARLNERLYRKLVRLSQPKASPTEQLTKKPHKNNG